MANIYTIINKQIKAAKAARAAAPKEPDVDYAAIRREAIRRSYDAMPHLQKAVAGFLARVAQVRPHMPTAPMMRTTTAQAAYVVCFGWNNPKAANQYVYETNIFWLSYDRHNETQPTDTEQGE